MLRGGGYHIRTRALDARFTLPDAPGLGDPASALNHAGVAAGEDNEAPVEGNGNLKARSRELAFGEVPPRGRALGGSTLVGFVTERLPHAGLVFAAALDLQEAVHLFQKARADPYCSSIPILLKTAGSGTPDRPPPPGHGEVRSRKQVAEIALPAIEPDSDSGSDGKTSWLNDESDPVNWSHVTTAWRGT